MKYKSRRIAIDRRRLKVNQHAQDAYADDAIQRKKVGDKDRSTVICSFCHRLLPLIYCKPFCFFLVSILCLVGSFQSVDGDVSSIWMVFMVKKIQEYYVLKHHVEEAYGNFTGSQTGIKNRKGR